MTKEEEKGHGNSCFNKAAQDEPIFILRATDILAPIVIRYWARLAQDTGTDTMKIRAAWEVANAMRDWPARKLPD